MWTIYKHWIVRDYAAHNFQQYFRCTRHVPNTHTHTHTQLHAKHVPLQTKSNFTRSSLIQFIFSVFISMIRHKVITLISMFFFLFLSVDLFAYLSWCDCYEERPDTWLKYNSINQRVLYEVSPVQSVQTKCNPIECAVTPSSHINLVRAGRNK